MDVRKNFPALVLLAASWSLADMPDCFSPANAQMVLPYGFGFAGATWNDPTVLKVGSNYVMYASANHTFQGKVEIYRLLSPDGIQWTLNPVTPVFSPDSLPWDSGGVETPSVVQFNGKYHLYTTSYPVNDPFRYVIGHAVSDDGIVWVRDSIPVLSPTGNAGDWNGYIAAEPGTVVVGNQLYLYFTSVGIDSALGSSSQVIGLAVSNDGRVFSAPRKVLSPNRAIYPRVRGWVGFSTPSAAWFQNQFHLFTDVANDSTTWTQMELRHFASTPGDSNWAYDSRPIFTRPDFVETRREIRSIAPYVEGDSLRMIYFAGDEVYTVDSGVTNWHLDRWGIWMATCIQPPSDLRSGKGATQTSGGVRIVRGNGFVDFILPSPETVESVSISDVRGKRLFRTGRIQGHSLRWQPVSGASGLYVLRIVRTRSTDVVIGYNP